MTKCIAFHSYKGGTGKTTIAVNFAALLAKKGYRVFLIELDVYAPSLHRYFNLIEPIKWLNDFLNGTAEIGDVLVDLTPTIINTNNKPVNGNCMLASLVQIKKRSANLITLVSKIIQGYSYFAGLYFSASK